MNLQDNPEMPSIPDSSPTDRGSIDYERPEFTRERLSPVELEVLAWLEQKRNLDKVCPSQEDIFMEFTEYYDSVADVEKKTGRPVFKRAMNNRGLFFPVDRIKLESRLTPQQVNAVAMILDFNDKRTIPEKLRKLNIATSTWQAWQKQPTFKNYLSTLLAENPDQFAVNLQEALFKAVDRGSVDAIKLGYELIGQPIGNSAQNQGAQNLELMIRRLVESIQRHVENQEILKKIAQDFEYIKQGLNPPIEQKINPLLDAAINEV